MLPFSHILKLTGLGIGFMAINIIGHAFQILSLTLYWNYSLFYSVNSKIVGFLWRLAQQLFEQVNGATVTFSKNVESIKNDGKNGFIMSNHLSYSDWYLLHAFAMRAGILGYLRYFAKDTLKYIPIFGWGMWIMGMLFVKRSSKEDGARIQQQFLKFQKCRDPVYIVSFLEGTRLTQSKLARSQHYSKENNFPILKHVLFPRYKGFVTTIQALRDKGLTKVYDLTIGYYHIPTQTVNEVIPRIHTLNARPPKEWRFHVHVDEYMVSDLPLDNAGLRQWVIDRYVEKDKRIASWCQKFPNVKDDGIITLPYF
eukprot:NODE_264_length_11354_cov_1.067170.p5 type:complete len:311 gc:universal NODE_264_length_11354_cov_1.067170:9131-10063(+)